MKGKFYVIAGTGKLKFVTNSGESVFYQKITLRDIDGKIFDLKCDPDLFVLNCIDQLCEIEAKLVQDFKTRSITVKVVSVVPQ